MEKVAASNWIRSTARAIENNRLIVSNVTSLFSLQLANYIFPLLTFPYLVRVLGPDQYGLIAFAQAFISFFILATEYGFGFSGVRTIALIKADREAVSSIFSTIMVIKTGMMFLSFFALCLLLLIVPRFRIDWMVYLLTFGMVLENVLFPTWLFQGMQDMKVISVRSIAAKAGYTVCIFCLVTSSADYLLVPLIYAASSLTTGLYGLRYAMKRYGIRLRCPEWQTIKKELKNGWPFFTSTVAIRLYTASNAFVLGLFAGNAAVGIYSAAERIIRILTELCRPLFQALYPHIATLFARSPEEAVNFLRPVFRSVAVISLGVFVTVLLLSNQIVDLVLGGKYGNATVTFVSLTPLLLFVPISHIFANLTLVPFRLDACFARIYPCAAVLNGAMLLLLVGVMDLAASGSALATVAVEGVTTFVMYRILKSHKILLWK